MSVQRNPGAPQLLLKVGEPFQDCLNQNDVYIIKTEGLSLSLSLYDCER